MTLGEAVREARIAKKTSLRELASMLEVTPSYVCDIEHDRRNPSEDVLGAIALILDMDKSVLMAKAGRLSVEAERYARQHPMVWRLIEKIASQGLCDMEIELLMTIARGIKS